MLILIERGIQWRNSIECKGLRVIVQFNINAQTISEQGKNHAHCFGFIVLVSEIWDVGIHVGTSC